MRVALTPLAPRLSRHLLSPREKSTIVMSRLLPVRSLLLAPPFQVPLLPLPLLSLQRLRLQHLIPLLPLCHLLPLLQLWRLRPLYLPPSRHQFPRDYARGLRGLRTGKLAWDLSQIKMRGNPGKGRPQKREMTRPREPKLLSKHRQQQQGRDWEVAVPAQRSKLMFQNQVSLLFFERYHDYDNGILK